MAEHQVEISMSRVHVFYCRMRQALHDVYVGAQSDKVSNLTLALEGMLALIVLSREIVDAAGGAGNLPKLLGAAGRYSEWKAALEKDQGEIFTSEPIRREELN